MKRAYAGFLVALIVSVWAVLACVAGLPAGGTDTLSECSKGPNAVYSVGGTVRQRSGTGPVLAGAMVEIAGRTATTNRNGSFKVTGVPAGTHKFTISKAGYRTKMSTVYNIQGNRSGLVFYLKPLPTYYVSGTVRQGSAAGPALAGATVEIAGRTATTNRNGNFKVTGVPAGTYKFTISKTGYSTKTSTVYNIQGNRSGLMFYLKPLPTYYVSGTVRQGSAAGPALAGATVRIAGKQATTYSNGSFKIAGIPAGSYSLTISKPGYSTKTTPILIEGNTSGLLFYLSQEYARLDLKIASTDATSVRLQWRHLPNTIEYQVSRDGIAVGSTVGIVGTFTDFGLRPGQTYRYTVTALDASSAPIARSAPTSATTTESTTIRTHYTVLAIAFNPGKESLVTEETYLKHRIQFLRLASLGSAVIELYQGRIISSTARPQTDPGNNRANYIHLVTRRDLPELNGSSIVDLVEQGAIDHVWVVKSPVDFWENVLIGNRPIHGEGTIGANTWLPVPVKSSRSFFVNSYLPDERSYDAYAHMVEGVMTSVSDGHPDLWPRNLPYTVYTHDRNSLATMPALLNRWEQFRLADGWNGTSKVAYASEGNGNVGSSHFPPNTPRECPDYCYYNAATWQRYVDSSADVWQNFPSFSSSKRKLNGYDFGAFNHYVEGDQSYSAAFGTSPELHPSFKFGSASYHQWWFAHLPHNPGVTDGSLNTWWPYIFDFNRFNGTRIEYKVDGFRKIPTSFGPIRGEYGTDVPSAEDWGYWHSQNGFSPGGKAGEVGMVSRATVPAHVKSGQHALKVSVENAQYWEGWGVGRNDVFYPVSRNARWVLPNLAEVRFSIKPGDNAELLQGTNPIVRLYKNGGNRIELVPRDGGVYANLFKKSDLRDAEGWYSFKIPLDGDAEWEKNVIGYIDPLLPEPERQAAKAEIEREVLADLNWVEISIRSTTSQWTAPYDVVTFFIDGLELLDR